jgi:hypothetical protein
MLNSGWDSLRDDIFSTSFNCKVDLLDGADSISIGIYPSGVPALLYRDII